MIAEEETRIREITEHKRLRIEKAMGHNGEHRKSEPRTLKTLNDTNGTLIGH